MNGLPCVVFALRREMMYLSRGLPLRQRVDGPCPAWLAGRGRIPVLVVVSGVGGKAAARAAEWLVRAVRPSHVIAAGFAGGLARGSRVGDLLLPDEVLDASGRLWPTTAPPLLIAPQRGRLLTWPSLVGSAQEKRELGKRFGAVAVDMESAVLARRCYQGDVPFAALRVISDAADTGLSPSLVRLLSGGRVSAWGACRELVRRPGLVLELGKLARATRTAARRLARGLAAWPGLTSGEPVRAPGPLIGSNG